MKDTTATLILTIVSVLMGTCLGGALGSASITKEWTKDGAIHCFASADHATCYKTVKTLDTTETGPKP